ncbi:MAG TPA: GNAT family protein [Candidatus Paceibacterota bacterium]
MKIDIRENLELRTLEIPDAQVLFDVIRKNDAYLREWLPWLDDDKAVTDIVKYIEGSNKRFSKKQGVDLSIWYDNHLVGGIGLYPWDKTHKKTSIGYWLAEEFQGRGIMNDSLKKVLKYGFTEMGLNRIEVCCAVGNTKSSALPKKLGFTYEGIERQGEFLYDHFVDMEVYSLLAKEWQKQN